MRRPLCGVYYQIEALHDLLGMGITSRARHREILAVLPSLRHPASVACLRGALEAALRNGFGFDGEAGGFVDDGEAAGWFASALREIGDAAALGVLVNFAVCVHQRSVGARVPPGARFRGSPPSVGE